jgi:hypothetical protein
MDSSTTSGIITLASVSGARLCDTSLQRFATGDAEFDWSALSLLWMAASLTFWTSIFANSSISRVGISSSPWDSGWSGYPSAFQCHDSLLHRVPSCVCVHSASNQRLSFNCCHNFPRQGCTSLRERPISLSFGRRLSRCVKHLSVPTLRSGSQVLHRGRNPQHR